MIHSSSLWTAPTAIALVAYTWMTPLLLLAIVAVWILLFRLQGPKEMASAAQTVQVPRHEWFACGALVMVLPVQILVASFEHGYFFPKYAVDTSLGISLLLAWALPAVSRRLLIPLESILALSVLAFLLFFSVSLFSSQLAKPAARAELPSLAVSPLLLHAPGSQPIVVANAYDFTTDWWYVDAGLKQRLAYLYDIPDAVKHSDFIPELSLANDAPYLGLSIVPFSQFTSSQSHFLLLCSGLERLNLTVSRLDPAEWQLTPLAKAGNDTLYQVDRKTR
jgi:hypothetical protein